MPWYKVISTTRGSELGQGLGVVTMKAVIAETGRSPTRRAAIWSKLAPADFPWICTATVIATVLASKTVAGTHPRQHVSKLNDTHLSQC
jgi:hypothetical protein